MFKRLILIAVALLMLLGTAFAEGLPAFEPYTAALPAPEGAEWKEDGDLRVLNLENDIQIHVCLIDENIAALTVVAPAETDFSEAAVTAICALNVLSEESLNQLCALSEETALEGYLITPMRGKSYAGIAIRPSESEAEWVWQPLRGGEKYHAKPICGRTEAPRLETKEAAEALDFAPCGKCFKAEN